MTVNYRDLVFQALGCGLERFYPTTNKWLFMEFPEGYTDFLNMIDKLDFNVVIRKGTYKGQLEIKLV